MFEPPDLTATPYMVAARIVAPGPRAYDGSAWVVDVYGTDATERLTVVIPNVRDESTIEPEQVVIAIELFAGNFDQGRRVKGMLERACQLDPPRIVLHNYDDVRMLADA